MSLHTFPNLTHKSYLKKHLKHCLMWSTIWLEPIVFNKFGLSFIPRLCLKCNHCHLINACNVVSYTCRGLACNVVVCVRGLSCSNVFSVWLEEAAVNASANGDPNKQQTTSDKRDAFLIEVKMRGSTHTLANHQGAMSSFRGRFKKCCSGLSFPLIACAHCNFHTQTLSA